MSKEDNINSELEEITDLINNVSNMNEVDKSLWISNLEKLAANQHLINELIKDQLRDFREAIVSITRSIENLK